MTRPAAPGAAPQAGIPVPRVGLPPGATPIRLDPPVRPATTGPVPGQTAPRPGRVGPPPGPPLGASPPGPPSGGRPSGPPSGGPPLGLPSGPPSGGPRPGGAPPSGPGPAQSTGSRRLVLIGVVVLVTVAAVVGGVIAVASSRGGTPARPSATLVASSRTSSPAPATPTPTQTPDTEFDDAFTSTALRDYVRPYYDQITSCEKATTGSLASVQCTFDNDVRVQLFEIPTNISVTELRTKISPLLDHPDKQAWAHGQLWISEESVSALYWDQVDERVAALALLPAGNSAKLRTWWQTTFGSS